MGTPPQISSAAFPSLGNLKERCCAPRGAGAQHSLKRATKARTMASSQCQPDWAPLDNSPEPDMLPDPFDHGLMQKFIYAISSNVLMK
jgi:hypothetical protein